ncbi:MAG: glutathione S-transferase family protein [Acidimicrobiales bacterium]|nr:glutathione S-transferase family protein [Acidimicrobiales bacterium]
MSNSAAQIVIGGAFSSPYSLKMRAVLRYRHIPFRWVLRNSRWDDIPAAPVPVIPVLAWPDGAGGYADVMVDSSPQITRLEGEFAERSVVPTDPALAFVDFLLEDFADEWVTKAMYHYRWTYEPDIEKAGWLLPLDQNLQLDDGTHALAHDAIIERQVGRRALVGSTDANLPIIEGSYRRVLAILQRHFGQRDFLLGDRPSRVDFALYGQLKPMLWWDPTPMAVAVELAPRAVNWIERIDDLSWWNVDGDNGWFDVDQLDDTVLELLTEAGRTYAPFMLANAAALKSEADAMSCQIDGAEYRQGPFKYQGKCLTWVREQYSHLDHSARTRANAVLTGTGCEALLT